MLVGDPFLQNVFASALKLSRFWHGLPFLCSGVSPSATPLVNMTDDQHSFATWLFSFAHSSYARKMICTTPSPTTMGEADQVLRIMLKLT